jgi:hypothetical protein
LNGTTNPTVPSVIFPVIREFGSLPSHHDIENFRKHSTRFAVDRSARCLLEPCDALPLLEIVPGRYQYAARFLTEHSKCINASASSSPDESRRS